MTPRDPHPPPNKYTTWAYTLIAAIAAAALAPLAWTLYAKGFNP